MEKAVLGALELELLKFITENAPITVREATVQFGMPKGLARTTILTTMERLRTKGYLTRSTSPGVNRYSPVIGRVELLRGMVKDFIDTTLEGSLSPLVAYLANDAKLSRQELDDLKRLVQEMDSREGEK